MRSIFKFFSLLLILLISTISFAQVTLSPVWVKKAGEVSWLTTDNATRGLAYNPVTDHVYVVSRTGGLKVVILDAATGDSLGTLDVTGISGGTFPLNMIDVADDGVIYACNLVTSANSTFKVYRWADENAQPSVAVSWTSDGRYGDAFAVFGSGTGTKIYASGGGNDKVAVFGTSDGVNFTFEKSVVVGSGRARLGVDVEVVGGDTLIWGNGAGTLAGVWKQQDGTLVGEIPGNILASSAATADLGHVSSGRKLFFSLITGAGVSNPYFKFAVLDVTNGAANARLIAITDSITGNSNTNATGRAVYDPVRHRMIALATNNFVASFPLTFPGYLRNDNTTTHTSGITINEICARAAIVDFNADGSISSNTDQDEYIEIVNSSNVSIDISGWTLGDNAANFTFPAGTVLGPGKAAVVFTQGAGVSNFNPGPGNYVFSAPSNFALANTNDAVGLKNTNGLYIMVKWGTGDVNSSFKTGATLVGSITLQGSWNEGQSRTRQPDYTGSWDHHPTIQGTVNWSNNNPTRTLIDPKGSPGRFYDRDVPLPVQVSSVVAELFGRYVKIKIRTYTEDDEFLGFNIYRSDDGESFNLIASYENVEGLRSKRASDAFGSEYEFIDRDIVRAGEYYYKVEAVGLNERRFVGDVIKVVVEFPDRYVLHQNYPNPFNPETFIEFELAKPSRVRLAVYDVLGREVKVLLDGEELEAGRYKVRFDADGLSSGVYYYRLMAGEKFIDVKKMVLMK